MGQPVTVRLFSQQPVTAASVSGRPAGTRTYEPPWDLRIEGYEPVSLPFPLLVRQTGGSLQFVVKLPVEAYVEGVLAGEMGGERGAAALQAVAVAARSYAGRFRGRHRDDGYDFCDTTHCQDYRAVRGAPDLAEAVEQTASERLWYQGQAAAGYYAQSCGGHTEAAANVWPDQAAPYLRARPDPHCPRLAWRAEIPREKLDQAMRSAGLQLGSGPLSVAGRSPSGRVSRLRGSGGKVIAESSFRFAIGRELGWNLLRSALYELEDSGSVIVARGQGAGHGVGLCQAGAAEMSRRGSSYREILAHYFPGATVGVNARGFPWQKFGGERFDLYTTTPQRDQVLLERAERLAAALEAKTGLRLKGRPALRVYPTVAAFRDGTGEPGWVAASVRGSTIRLQPGDTAAAALRHELAHLLVESHAHPGLPLWFREGYVLYLAGQRPGAIGPPPGDAAFRRGSAEELRAVYRRAAGAVNAIATRHGAAALRQALATGKLPD